MMRRRCVRGGRGEGDDVPLHPQVNELVGDFTSLTLLMVDGTGMPVFEARARRLQQQLWDDLEHRHVTGVRVLRDLARAQGRTVRAVMPVVFTSLLTLPARRAGSPSLPVESVYQIVTHAVQGALAALIYKTA